LINWWHKKESWERKIFLCEIAITVMIIVAAALTYHNQHLEATISKPVTVVYTTETERGTLVVHAKTEDKEYSVRGESVKIGERNEVWINEKGYARYLVLTEEVCESIGLYIIPSD